MLMHHRCRGAIKGRRATPVKLQARPDLILTPPGLDEKVLAMLKRGVTDGPGRRAWRQACLGTLLMGPGRRGGRGGAGRERCCPATIEVQVRPSTEFSLDRAQARLRALPPPATLRHASVEDRQLYARMLNHLDNPESVRCAGALLVALKDGRAGAPLDPEDERDAIVVRSFYLWVSTPSRARVLSRTPPLIPVRSSRAGAAGVAHHAAHARERAVHVNANTLASLQIFQADVHASTTSKDSLSVFGTRRAPNWAKRCASNMKAVCIPSRCSCRYSRAGLLNTCRTLRGRQLLRYQSSVQPPMRTPRPSLASHACSGAQRKGFTVPQRMAAATRAAAGKAARASGCR